MFSLRCITVLFLIVFLIIGELVTVRADFVGEFERASNQLIAAGRFQSTPEMIVPKVIASQLNIVDSLESSNGVLAFPHNDTQPGYELLASSATDGSAKSVQPKKDRPLTAVNPSSSQARKKIENPAGSASRPRHDSRRIQNSAAQNEVTRIQHWTVEDYTRVAIYLKSAATFQESGKASQAGTGRIELEIPDCGINSGVKRQAPLPDRFLKAIQVEKTRSGGTKVMLLTNEVSTYRVLQMSDPPRLVIDVRGRTEAAKPQGTVAVPTTKGRMPGLLDQLGLGVKRIVIDPGHGGKDKGATGYSGLFEKDVTLSIATQLKSALEKKTGCEVILTRTTDRFLSLEERTAIANGRKADLFISIHANAHKDSSKYGVETYSLNFSRDSDSARVAAFENATSTRTIGELQSILKDLLFNAKVKESARLASDVQAQLVRKLCLCYPDVRDLGTKQAPFYVLMGAEMPSILVETAFLSNAREEHRLRDAGFRSNLATAITEGIESFINRLRAAGEERHS